MSQYNIGWAYETGQDVAKDYAKAVTWYERSVKLDLDLAQTKMGSMYYYGRGVEKDYGKAGKWYLQAAGQGDAEAQYYLGYMYYQGQGFARDYQQAHKWYELAAKQNHAGAQFNLGYMYEIRLVFKYINYAEALKWYNEAAMQGNADAQEKLGHMYSKGQGVSKDYVQAYAWAYLASVQSHDSYLINRLSRRMDSKEKNAAIVRANLLQKHLSELKNSSIAKNY